MTLERRLLRVGRPGCTPSCRCERGSPTPVDWFEIAQTQTRKLGPAARPVVVPVHLDDVSLQKASGRVELPLHIRWSGLPLTDDLDNRSDRACVYEQSREREPQTTCASTSTPIGSSSCGTSSCCRPQFGRRGRGGSSAAAAPRRCSARCRSRSPRSSPAVKEAAGFALAGGGALILRGDVRRQTRDLDFFELDVGADARLSSGAGPVAPRLTGEELAFRQVRSRRRRTAGSRRPCSPSC